ncbi:MAG: hypothetical protein ABSG37_01970 [Candidatus Limnocylindrales bacterium]|jgi:hypothetical protein
MDSAAFGAAEQFVEGTIAAALVALWLLAVALHLARPYMLALTRKFTLRLGADLWWTIYVGMRDVFLLQVFLGSFIFFYPDVVKADDLPITGGLAAVCAFGALMLKLMTRADADARSFNAQTFLIGLGATLYLVPYLLGVQVTTVGSSISNQLASVLVSSQNQTIALALCYLSALLVGIMGLVAVVYNLRLASPAARKVDAGAVSQPATQS